MRVKTHISIKNQMEELEELNLSLEEKVRERTLELFKAKEKAEESDRLKSAFLMNISHEIRTPMNGILGFAQILEMKNLDDAQKLEFINLLKSSGQRLINTINDIIENADDLLSRMQQIWRAAYRLMQELLEYGL